jgi:serine protease Do
VRLVPIPIIAILLCVSPDSSANGQQPTIDIQKLEEKIQAVLPKIRACTVGVGNGGSGVVISKEGLVLSCAHVALEAGRRIQIRFPDGTSVRATTLGNHRDADAALIRIDQKGDYPFAPMAESGDAKVGDWVLAMGYPVTFSKRAPPPVRIGRVVRTARNVLISDAPIMGGDSGGPLFSMDGTVIGINSRVSSNIASNVHVPINQFRDNWDRLLASEDWPERRSSGTGGRRPQRPQQRQPEQTPQMPPADNDDPFKTLGIEVEKTDQGVMVKSLTLGSLADKSGVRAAHILMKIGDKEVTDIAQCRAELKKYMGKQKTVNITVTRADAAHAKVTKALRLQEKKP